MTELEVLSDAELLALTPGNPDAFAVFYRRHSRAVLAFVARRVSTALLSGPYANMCST